MPRLIRPAAATLLIALITACASARTGGPGGPTDAVPRASVSVGSQHSCGVTASGQAYCWGYTAGGRLGTGHEGGGFAERIAVRVSGDLSLLSVSAGNMHTCGVTTRGEAYCWGEGGGSGTEWGTNAPSKVSGDLVWASASAGEGHTCGVTTSGQAYCWGLQLWGQLGNGLDGWGGPHEPTPVVGNLAWTSVNAGGAHTCGITTGGEAYCWGKGYGGTLGNGTTEDTSVPSPVFGDLMWASISAGGFHTCGVTTSGDIHCWGLGNGGRLGNGTNDDTAVPSPVSGSLSWASVSAGEWHTCGVTTSGVAYCWGEGVGGKLGNGTDENSAVPSPVSGDLTWASVSAGQHHTCGVNTNGEAYCWGESDQGLLGAQVFEDSFVPVRVVYDRER